MHLNELIHLFSQLPSDEYLLQDQIPETLQDYLPAAVKLGKVELEIYTGDFLTQIRYRLTDEGRKERPTEDTPDDSVNPYAGKNVNARMLVVRQDRVY